MDLQQKQCPKCGIVKTINDFHKRTKRKSGLQFYCKECHWQNWREYRINNPITDQTNRMVAAARSRAKAKDLPFDIDHEYVRSLVVSQCPVFGTPLEWSTYRGRGPGAIANSPSLDRIDPTKGYVKGNVWIISHKANTIKNNATHEELKLVTEAVGRAIVNSLDW